MVVQVHRSTSKSQEAQPQPDGLANSITESRTERDLDSEFVIKIVAEASVVGGIAITVIRFLMTRLIKQIDDTEELRRAEHRQLILWFAALSRTMLSWEKELAVHTATVHGVNPSTGDNQDERDTAACRQFRTLVKDLEEQTLRLDLAIQSMQPVEHARTYPKV
jgi:hypothetical protein